MPRYLVERVIDNVDEQEMEAMALRAAQLDEDQRFGDLVWEHSHVIDDETSGRIKSFCVYEAPSVERVKQHAQVLGNHTIAGIYEILDDISPAQFAR